MRGSYENLLGVRSDFPLFVPQSEATVVAAGRYATAAGAGAVRRAVESPWTGRQRGDRLQASLHLSVRRVARPENGRASEDAAGTSLQSVERLAPRHRSGKRPTVGRNRI